MNNSRQHRSQTQAQAIQGRTILLFYALSFAIFCLAAQILRFAFA